MVQFNFGRNTAIYSTEGGNIYRKNGERYELVGKVKNNSRLCHVYNLQDKRFGTYNTADGQITLNYDSNRYIAKNGTITKIGEYGRTLQAYSCKDKEAGIGAIVYLNNDQFEPVVKMVSSSGGLGLFENWSWTAFFVGIAAVVYTLVSAENFLKLNDTSSSLMLLTMCSLVLGCAAVAIAIRAKWLETLGLMMFIPTLLSLIVYWISAGGMELDVVAAGVGIGFFISLVCATVTRIIVGIVNLFSDDFDEEKAHPFLAGSITTVVAAIALACFMMFVGKTLPVPAFLGGDPSYVVPAGLSEYDSYDDMERYNDNDYYDDCDDEMIEYDEMDEYDDDYVDEYYNDNESAENVDDNSSEYTGEYTEVTSLKKLIGEWRYNGPDEYTGDPPYSDILFLENGKYIYSVSTYDNIDVIMTLGSYEMHDGVLTLNGEASNYFLSNEDKLIYTSNSEMDYYCSHEHSSWHVSMSKEGTLRFMPVNNDPIYKWDFLGLEEAGISVNLSIGDHRSRYFDLDGSQDYTELPWPAYDLAEYLNYLI